MSESPTTSIRLRLPQRMVGVTLPSDADSLYGLRWLFETSGAPLPPLPPGYPKAPILDLEAGQGLTGLFFMIRLEAPQLFWSSDDPLAAGNLAGVPGRRISGLDEIATIGRFSAARLPAHRLAEVEPWLDRFDHLYLHCRDRAERIAAEALLSPLFLKIQIAESTPWGPLALYQRRSLAQAVGAADTLQAGWRLLAAGDAMRALAQFAGDQPEFWLGRAVSHLRLGQLDEAKGLLLHLLQRTITLETRLAYAELLEALVQAGNSAHASDLAVLSRKLRMRGAPDLADLSWDAAEAIDASAPELAWSRDRNPPLVYRSQAEQQDWHGRVTAAMDHLARDTKCKTPEDAERALRGLGIMSHFALGYFITDERPLLERFGAMASRVMAANLPHLAKRPKKRKRKAGEKIRVGYVSSAFSGHTIALLFNGWIRHADHDAFELHLVLSIGGRADRVTETLARHADHFHDLSQATVQELAEHLAGLKLDILVYPDIGMESWGYSAAALPLAPVQCVAWGHPVTTGLPTMDYFLSSELMEPDGAEAHYSEKLIRLPRLSIAYRRPILQAPPVSAQELGLPRDGVIYLCSQALKKYQPQYDRLFPAIAKRVPDARFVFLEFGSEKTAAKYFKLRLSDAFLAEGLRADDHLIFLPGQSWERFVALNQHCHVFLDSIGWSGGNTALEALSQDLPLVTWPGQFMRGRHSAAFLRLIGAEDWIADSFEDYVEKAARLGREPQTRRAYVQLIRDNGHRLFDDVGAVRALEDFFRKVTS